MARSPGDAVYQPPDPTEQQATSRGGAAPLTATPPGVEPPGASQDNTFTPRTEARFAAELAAAVESKVSTSPLGSQNADDLQASWLRASGTPARGGDPTSGSSGAASSNTMPPGMRVPVVRSIATPQAERSYGTKSRQPSPAGRQSATGPEVTQDLVNKLLDRIHDMSQQISALQQQIWDKKTDDKDGTPYMNPKDVEKPPKFSGEKWGTWEMDLKNFMARRDERWKDVLDVIKSKSDKPLTEDGILFLRGHEKLKKFMGKQGVYEAFRSQLYEYLKTYTGGDVHTMVLTNGVDQSFETWRRLCDQGRSLRERPMRDEKRALYHPKQATLDTVIKAIADWEKRMADYVAARPDERHMEDDEKIMCLEDICPEVIQKYLSEKRHLKLVVKYEDYKDAIDQYFYEERRWGKGGRQKLHAIEDQGGDGHDAGDDQCRPCNVSQLAALETVDCAWTSALLGEINALVKGKLRDKGKGKNKAGSPVNPYGAAPMDVDVAKESERNKDKTCYECGKPGHIGRDCAVRQARVAAGGPAILKGDGKGKGGNKGGKNGGPKGGPQAWPSQAQWKTMYPGPSPTQWNNWYSWAGQGKANLFEAPHQLSSLQSLFQGPSAYSIVPKNKAAKQKTAANQEPPSFETGNRFKALTEDVDIKDLIKAPSRNQLRREAKQAEGADAWRGAKVVSADPLASLPVTGRPGYRRTASADADSGVRGGMGLPADEAQPAETPKTAKSASTRRNARRRIPPWEVPEVTIEPGQVLELVDSDDESEQRHPEHHVTRQRVRNEALAQADGGRARLGSSGLAETDGGRARLGSSGRRTPEGAKKSKETNDELLNFVMDPLKAITARATGGLMMLNEVRKGTSLCPVTGIASEIAEKNSIGIAPVDVNKLDPSTWEVLLAIMDSGATVPVLHPKTGKDYEVEESPASKAGVEYEIANGDTLPNLGQKRIAVMTEEGTVRGYSSQCADVSKSLQSVRAMVGSKHAVCFGLGPEGQDHLIINRVSGEINRMVDDGVNYLQRLRIIPPDQLDAVQAMIGGKADGDPRAQDFHGQGR